MRPPTVLTLGLVVLSLPIVVLSFVPVAAAQAAPDRVLGMRLEGVDLLAKDRDDLFHVVQAKLRRYPSIDLLKPPEAELMDEMLELECFEIDVDCLTKLGTKYGASKVFYAEVNPVDTGFMIKVSIVDATTGQAVRQRESVVMARADLAGALEREVEAVFGQPPPPKPAEGTLVVEAAIAGAQIFVDGTYAGTGRIELKQKPGSYSVRVARDGYEEALFQMDVVAGKQARRTVRLEALPEPATPPVVVPAPSTEDEDTPVYETWWFWTALVGGVAVASAAIAVPVVLSSESGPAPTGSMVISMEGTQAWRDSSLRGGVGAAR